jgi:hypothetical protein
MGTGVNSPRPAGGDEGRKSCALIGLGVRRRSSGKEPRRQKTVPETDTGGLVEHTEALERMVLKELGKLPS